MLYNITFNCLDDRVILEPTIPYSAGDDEDRQTKRVCFSSSIEGCISAIGPSFRDLKVGGELLVRSASMLFMDESKLISPQRLFDSGKVPDALYTNEYWYLEPIHVDVHKYKILDFTALYDINWSVIFTEHMKELVSPFVDSNQLKNCLTSKEVYKLLCANEQYFALEHIDDLVESIPWSQVFKVKNLVLESC